MNKLLMCGLLVGVMYGCSADEQVVVMNQHVRDYEHNRYKNCRESLMRGEYQMWCDGLQPMIDFTTGELTWGYN